MTMNLIAEFEERREKFRKKAEIKTKQERKQKEEALKHSKGKRICDGNGLEENLDAMVLREVTSDILRGIGNRLVEIREKQGLTQKEVAQEFRVCQTITDTALSKWESGTNAVSIIYLLWFSQRFDVDLHWLMTGERRNSQNEIKEEALQKVQELSKILEKF